MGKMNNEFKRIPDNLDCLLKQSGVIGTYLIVDKNTDMAYVGSTNDLLSRKSKHEALLNNNKHHNKKMQKAFNNGADLEFIGVELHDRDAAYDFEQVTIDDFYHSGLLYNRAINARDGYSGLPLTDETRQKMRIAQLGKKRDPTVIEKVRIANTGKKRTEEMRRHLSKVKTGTKASVETKQKLRNSHLGYIMPQEQKQKISESNKRKEITETHRKNLSLALKGKKHTEETKEKLRLIKTGSKHTQSAKEKIRLASTGRIMPRESVERSRLLRTGSKRTKEQIDNLKNSPASLSRAKAVVANNIEYFSIGEAARQNKIVYSTALQRLNSPNFPEWYFK